MTTDLSALPFPVYGLEATWRGERFVDTWNRLWTPDGPLWNVVLGHERRAQSMRIGVITDGKLGPQEVRDDVIGPTGLADARRMALVEATVIAFSEDVASSEFVEALRRAGNGSDESASTPTKVTVDVDGAGLGFDLVTVKHAWAAFADLGKVAVAVYGAGTRFEDLALMRIDQAMAVNYLPVDAECSGGEIAV